VVALLEAAWREGRLHHAYCLACADESAAFAAAQPLIAARLCGKCFGGCGQCPSCAKFRSHNHPDVHHVGPDASGAIKVDPVRALGARLHLRAMEAGATVAVIRSADQMNVVAQNALLKVIEEPPGAVSFVLTARRFMALLPTVRSRVVRVRIEAPGEASVEPPPWAERLVGFFQDPRIAAAPALATELAADRDTALSHVELQIHQALRRGQRMALAADALRQFRRDRSVNANAALGFQSILLAASSKR
jgi:hypothetical protein